MPWLFSLKFKNIVDIIPRILYTIKNKNFNKALTRKSKGILHLQRVPGW
jgi:hypothetical protein